MGWPSHPPHGAAGGRGLGVGECKPLRIIAKRRKRGFVNTGRGVLFAVNRNSNQVAILAMEIEGNAVTPVKPGARPTVGKGVHISIGEVNADKTAKVFSLHAVRLLGVGAAGHVCGGIRWGF